MRLASAYPRDERTEGRVREGMGRQGGRKTTDNHDDREGKRTDGQWQIELSTT